VQPGGWRRWFYWAGGRAALDAVEAFSAIGEVGTARDLIATLPPDARELPVAEACVAAAEGRLPPEVVDKLRARLGDYNLYQRHGIRI